MLSGLLAAGKAVGDAAAARARDRLADALRGELPRVAVTVEGDAVVLVGRISASDPRLRWTGSLLR